MNKASPTFAALSSVIADGDIITLRSYLENDNYNPNESDEYGQTLLMVAAQHGQTAIVNELILQGADVNAEDSDGWSALTNAAKVGHNDIVIKLLDHGAFIEKRDMGSWTPLMWACYKGHYTVVQTLLEHDATVNVHDKFHCTCLIWAAGRGYFDIVNVLLENGAKVNSGDKFGSSPLVWACRKGFTEIVRVLLEDGANVDTAGMFSWTPLIVAAKGNYTAIVNMLLEHKPNVNAVDMDGCTALTTACKDGYIEIAVALMNAGAYINLQDRNGDTNLIHAAKAGHFSIVDAFLKKYADVDLHGSERKTALYWAVEKGYVDIVRLLLAANPNLESPTKDGDTPLLKATRIRNAEIVQLLVDKKCKVSVTDKKSDTALHIAMRARSKAIVEILLRNPKNSQLLYRPNRAGETPYNIDSNHKRSILAQIFGARRLNTNEDSENRLGYDLYSSALADILSEPSLSMPISVGLYAKWGSGKSFLLNKLENEMRNFAIQWLDPAFEFSWFVFVIVTLISLTLGFVTSVASHMWIAGVLIAASIFVSSFVFLGAVIYGSKKYYWPKFSNISTMLAAQLNSLRTLLFVIFCSPPAKRRNTVSDPVKFLFTEQTKVTSSGHDNSIVQIVISLHTAIEKEYGFLTSRLYRVFRPKPVQAQKWQWRRLCCVPNFIITLFVFGCILGVLTLLFINSDSEVDTKEQRTVIHSLLISLGCVVSLILVSNLYTWMRLVAALIISHQRRIARNLALLESSHTMNYITSLKSEVDIIVQMVQCLDAFIAQQTRLVVIVDGLDSCEQEKVLHVLDAVHLLFSDVSAPFLTVLAIDPHIIIKAIESNINRVFHNTSISGHEYLRNVVHLPFYLQNSGLRRVKAAQQAAMYWAKKSASCWNEDRECDRAAATVSTSRKASNASISVPDTFRKRPTKGSQKLKASDSMASSISNLHRVVFGAQDLTKVLLTDDYFSDVNPRSMRRLMNIVYVTGRLLKAFTIDFNWYHLASWVNITEQWPYRTSWIILYYEMHENDLDEMMSLKCIYEKIKDYMPTSKEDDPSLDLDHDERKFKVFLSFHSSNLLINDLKIFLPFTINLDPYIRKTIQEENQVASEILKMDLKPSNQSNAKSDAAKWVQTQPQIIPKKSILASAKTGDQMWGPATPSMIQLNDKNFPPYHVTIGAPLMASPSSHYPNLAPWWNTSVEKYGPYASHAAASKLYSQVLPNGQKLSSLSVDDILSLLSTLEKVDQKWLQKYSSTLKENNINGQVLFTCELKELKDVLNMSFGDWEMFRVLILSLREDELTSGSLVAENPSQGLIHGPMPSQTLISHRSSPSGCDSPDLKKKDRTTNGISKLTAESLENRGFNRGRSISTVLEKQVTMEESMIVGALETLNEEALEDAREEKLSSHRDSNAASSGIASNPLSPIISDPEEQMLDGLSDSERMDQHPVTYTLNSPSEVDVMYLKNLRDSPMLHVSAASLCDSITDLETCSVGHTQHFQPIIESRFSPIPLVRTASNSAESVSCPSNKSVVVEKPKPKNLPSRPSSLVYDGTCPILAKKTSTESENSVSKPKTAAPTNKITSKSHDKFKQISHSISKRKSSKKKKHHDKKDNSSSSSSTETEELLLQPAKKSISVPEKVASPQSEADGFYSDDEHTPLVSPFHSNKSSQYNLQSALKHDKASTPEKVIPRQSQSDLSSCLKLRKPLERQFSMDNFLGDRTRLSAPDIKESLCDSSYSGHPASSGHGLPVYGQHVADTPSPETQPLEKSDSSINLHTETIL